MHTAQTPLESPSAIHAHVTRCLTDYARLAPTIVSYVDAMTECRVTLHKETGWVQYSKSFGCRRGITSARYDLRVQDAMHGCPRVVNGLLTLGAQRATVDTGPGERVWGAVWARAGRHGPVRETGFIVSRPDAALTRYAHGRTVGAARATLTRMGCGSRSEQTTRWMQSVREALVSGKLDGYDVPVTLDDARLAGLCTPGVKDWCMRHGIDVYAATTVGAIVGIADQRDYVLAVCLRAIRRRVRQPRAAMA
jgi:hypothetical protein